MMINLYQINTSPHWGTPLYGTLRQALFEEVLTEGCEDLEEIRFIGEAPVLEFAERVFALLAERHSDKVAPSSVAIDALHQDEGREAASEVGGLMGVVSEFKLAGPPRAPARMSECLDWVSVEFPILARYIRDTTEKSEVVVGGEVYTKSREVRRTSSWFQGEPILVRIPLFHDRVLLKGSL